MTFLSKGLKYIFKVDMVILVICLIIIMTFIIFYKRKNK